MNSAQFNQNSKQNLEILRKGIRQVKSLNFSDAKLFVEDFKTFLDYKNSLFLEAYLYFRVYNWPKVVQILSKAIDQNPPNYFSYLYIYGLLKTKQYKKAFLYSKKAAKLYGFSPILKWLVGRYFLSIKKYNIAKKFLFEALRAFSKSNSKKRAVILGDIGKIYMFKYNFDKAFKYLYQALKLEPFSPTLNKRLGMGYLYAADNFSYLKKFPNYKEKQKEFLYTSIFFFFKALEYCKDNSLNYLYYFLARAYFLLNNFSEAEKYFLAYLELSDYTKHVEKAKAYAKLCSLLKQKTTGQDWDLNPD